MIQPSGAFHAREVNAPGLGESRRAILLALKRSGGATVPVLARIVELNIETVREHLRALRSRGLIERRGTTADGPGRPTVVYGLTAEADALFPRREAEVLRELASYLKKTGRSDLLTEFFDDYIRRTRSEALVRVEGLSGRERLEEAARILSEQGFMALVEEDADGPELRLCHCPLRELVEVSKVPCRAEVGFVRDLVGTALTRIGYMPAGDAACSYRGSEC
jgi:predicted ArsR family transcriptional regulator